MVGSVIFGAAAKRHASDMAMSVMTRPLLK
jgi:hypothetical protein